MQSKHFNDNGNVTIIYTFMGVINISCILYKPIQNPSHKFKSRYPRLITEAKNTVGQH